MEVLIKYGDIKLEIPGEEDSDQTAAKYIEESLREDDIVLSSEIYNAILREAAQLPMSPEGHSLSYFINHPNAEVSKLAAELGEDKYQLSTNQKADFVSDRDRLFEVVQRLVHDYKHVLLKLQIAEVMQQLKDPAIIADSNKFMEVMKCYKDLLELQQEFAKFLGNRVVLK